MIGAADCGEELAAAAFEVGRELATRGATVLCGGRGGVMEAAARGASKAGGLVVGILPGSNAAESPPNPFVDLALFTGLGQARNQVLVLSGRAVIGIGGGWGTLTEIGLAAKHGIPAVLLESWELDRPDGAEEPLLRRARSPRQAVEMAMEMSER